MRCRESIQSRHPLLRLFTAVRTIVKPSWSSGQMVSRAHRDHVQLYRCNLQAFRRSACCEVSLGGRADSWVTRISEKKAEKFETAKPKRLCTRGDLCRGERKDENFPSLCLPWSLLCGRKYRIRRFWSFAMRNAIEPK
jgi:hypothetical protein